MLSNKPAHATIAVRDISEARNFYSDTLRLKELQSMGDDVMVYESGGAKIIVYRSEFAGTNKATSATWSVGEELEGLVNELRSKSVKFEHYEMLGLNRRGDVHVAGSFKAAWFKDPDGNILLINNQ
jgi:catechol 2,3-dioxygenase-like lactoylglutathione lyase family enzyme